MKISIIKSTTLTFALFSGMAFSNPADVPNIMSNICQQCCGGNYADKTQCELICDYHKNNCSSNPQELCSSMCNMTAVKKSNLFETSSSASKTDYAATVIGAAIAVLLSL